MENDQEDLLRMLSMNSIVPPRLLTSANSDSETSRAEIQQVEKVEAYLNSWWANGCEGAFQAQRIAARQYPAVKLCCLPGWSGEQQIPLFRYEGRAAELKLIAEFSNQMARDSVAGRRWVRRGDRRRRKRTYGGE